VKKSLDNYMKRLSLVLISSVAFMFAACGDSGNTASPQSNDNMPEGFSGQYVEGIEGGYVEVTPPKSSSSVAVPDVIGNILTDSRDGQTYRVVTIGNQMWMAQNLNYHNSQLTANSYCYDLKASNCAKYGRLYTLHAASWACPDGWRLPTKDHFEMLFTAVGGQSTAGKMLKSTSGWSDGGNGTDAYSFSALPAGFLGRNGEFSGDGTSTYFLTSTMRNVNYAYYVRLNYNDAKANLDFGGVSPSSNGLSVRCVKNQ